jgi:hypothetical protein
VCRALKVLCGAGSHDRLLEMKRAAVSVHWELVRGATSLDELVSQVDESRPDVVVIDSALGPDAASRVRDRMPNVRILAVGGPLEGANASTDLDGVRDAVLSLPPPAGPVRT